MAKPPVPEFLIDEIFPSLEVHMIYGPSGAGKTSWGFPFLHDLEVGNPIFGFQTAPTKCCYLALDRSTAEIERTLRRLGLLGQVCPYIGVEKVPREPDPGVIFRAAQKHNAQAVWVEAFLRVVRGRPGDYNTTADTIAECTRLCKANGVTIFAVMHTPKTRSGDGGINDPSQKALGSVALTAFGSTRVLFESVDITDPEDGRRRIIVMPRNAKAFKIEYIFNEDGRLIVSRDEPADLHLDAELAAFTGDTFDPKIAFSWGLKHGIAERTVKLWIQRRVDKSIQRLSRGKYAKLTIQ